MQYVEKLYNIINQLNIYRNEVFLSIDYSKNFPCKFKVLNCKLDTVLYTRQFILGC